MQSQIVLDLRLLNARHRARALDASASDYLAKLIAVPGAPRTAFASPDAWTFADEWPAAAAAGRFGFDA